MLDDGLKNSEFEVCLSLVLGRAHGVTYIVSVEDPKSSTQIEQVVRAVCVVHLWRLPRLPAYPARPVRSWIAMRLEGERLIVGGAIDERGPARSTICSSVQADRQML